MTSISFDRISEIGRVASQLPQVALDIIRQANAAIETDAKRPRFEPFLLSTDRV